MKIIDLRSDTVTLPTSEMMDAINSAALGDDVYVEDSTTLELEALAAQVTGKESALLVSSGTMGNLICNLIHARRGTEVIMGHKSHTFLYESGGISAYGGIHSHQLRNNDDGSIDLNSIKSAIRTENVHFPKSAAISLENTHNMCNGYPLSKDYSREVSHIAHENNIKLHIDGARIFNAAIAHETNVADLVIDADSVTFCLSKGLSAPVGSIICGKKDFIYHARRIRKALGGGMRQAGIIAAAGIVSLDKMISQIKNDHENAQKLAEGISQNGGLSVDIEKVKTNIIYFELKSSKLKGSELVNKMENKGIYFFETSPNRFRMVTHYGINGKDVNTTLMELDKIVN